MGRLRARLATTQVDQDIQKALVDAVKHAQKAQELCLLLGRSLEARRGRAEANKIQQAIRLLESVGLLAPRYDRDDPDLYHDSSDPDLTSELAKHPGWHRKKSAPKSPFAVDEGGE